MYLGQVLCDFGMAASELKETAEQRITWYFWEVLNLGSVCSIEVFDEEEEGCNNGNSNGLGRHRMRGKGDDIQK